MSDENSYPYDDGDEANDMRWEIAFENLCARAGPEWEEWALADDERPPPALPLTILSPAEPPDGLPSPADGRRRRKKGHRR